MTCTILTCVAVLLGAGSASAAPKRPVWLPKTWWAIALCETGGNWRHSTRDYVSAFGIYRGSWAAFRPAWVPADASKATPREQYAVALAIWRRYRFTGWGCFTHGGYRYWMGRI